MSCFTPIPTQARRLPGMSAVEIADARAFKADFARRTVAIHRAPEADRVEMAAKLRADLGLGNLGLTSVEVSADRLQVRA